MGCIIGCHRNIHILKACSCMLPFSTFNLWLHIQHHASSRLHSALLRRCPELWCCQRCLSDRSRWWKKAKRACTSGTCSSVLRTLLDVELLNALIQSDTICTILHIYILHPLIVPYQDIVLLCKNLLPCFGLFALSTAPRNYDCTTPQSLASGLRRRLLELEGYPPSHLMNPRGSRKQHIFSSTVSILCISCVTYTVWGSKR